VRQQLAGLGGVELDLTDLVQQVSAVSQLQCFLRGVVLGNVVPVGHTNLSSFFRTPLQHRSF